MSVSELVQMKEVVLHLRQARPPLFKRLPGELVLPPRSANYWLVGTAFDYALRFELKRRVPGAETAELVAEWSVEAMEEDGHRRAAEARRMLDSAMARVDVYIDAPDPTPAQREDMLRASIELAHLDPYFRALIYDPRPVERADVEDLDALLAAAPYEQLAREPLWLNPTFGSSSALVGGADTDLIVDGQMLEVKTSKVAEADKDWHRQLMLYVMLAEREASLNPDFPRVDRVGYYFARRARIWSAPVTHFTEHPAYPPARDAIFAIAAQLYGE